MKKWGSANQLQQRRHPLKLDGYLSGQWGPLYLYGLQTSQQVNKVTANGIAIHALASGAALPVLKEAARHTTDKLQQEGVVRLASHAASAPACMGKTAISTTVGLAAGTGISTGAGSVLATGLVAASAAPHRWR